MKDNDSMIEQLSIFGNTVDDKTREMNKRDFEYGVTPLFRVNNGKIEEYICMGCAEQLIWSHEDNDYRLARFIYAKNDDIISICFLIGEHDAFSHTPRMGREVFFTRLEAELNLVQTQTDKDDINTFVIRKRKRSRQ